MFRARFISGLRDFTRHFNFRYFARSTSDRNFPAEPEVVESRL